MLVPMTQPAASSAALPQATSALENLEKGQCALGYVAMQFKQKDKTAIMEIFQGAWIALRSLDTYAQATSEDLRFAKLFQGATTEW